MKIQLLLLATFLFVLGSQSTFAGDRSRVKKCIRMASEISYTLNEVKIEIKQVSEGEHPDKGVIKRLKGISKKIEKLGKKHGDMVKKLPTKLLQSRPVRKASEAAGYFNEHFLEIQVNYEALTVTSNARQLKAFYKLFYKCSGTLKDYTKQVKKIQRRLK